eukprot:TRINITY_DN1999_c0_g1_i3.p1 TRINITY_DN1999_c0_g1~~TRINITY_DN1999_c0_g1_i3.p1  ORF type:complete len:123 (-),score=13.08 TRINITY_DN1999_c0_g1_i3:303-671(-)
MQAAAAAAVAALALCQCSECRSTEAERCTRVWLLLCCPIYRQPLAPLPWPAAVRRTSSALLQAVICLAWLSVLLLLLLSVTIGLQQLRWGHVHALPAPPITPRRHLSAHAHRPQVSCLANLH